MAITHVTSIRNGLANLVVDAIDLGVGDASGDIVIMTSGDVEVATLTFSDPALEARLQGPQLQTLFRTTQTQPAVLLRCSVFEIKPTRRFSAARSLQPVAVATCSYLLSALARLIQSRSTRLRIPARCNGRSPTAG